SLWVLLVRDPEEQDPADAEPGKLSRQLGGEVGAQPSVSRERGDRLAASGPGHDKDGRQQLPRREAGLPDQPSKRVARTQPAGALPARAGDVEAANQLTHALALRGG